MRKLLIFGVFCISLVCGGVAHAGPMANVEYIHKAIERQWGITVPYNPNLKNPKVAANVKYLLTAVDRANEILNGTPTTDYGNGEYATMYAADTVATLDAAERLIKIEPKFFITTTPDTTSFEFNLSAAGTFQIDWGDGKNEIIVRTDTTSETYTHEYAGASGATDADGNPVGYTIGIGGRVTGYNSSNTVSTINFSGNKNTAKIDGSLGRVFSTIDKADGGVSQPRFIETFYNNSNLKSSIPETLFDGLYGQPGYAMFRNTFAGSGITGSIPVGLFSDLAGTPVGALFERTFQQCSDLTGEIPADLFAKIQGETSYATFLWTFDGCRGLTGSIPATLFSGIRGRPGSMAFWGTFSSCSGLTGEIPEDLFKGIQGAPTQGMFRETFFACTGLTGKIPEKLFAGIEGKPATAMFHQTFARSTGLTGEIPENLFKGIQGAPADGMFSGTFADCSNLTGEIPEKLFDGIETDAPAAARMFVGTFRMCYGLTGRSARIKGRYLYEIWPEETYENAAACYYNMRQLDDWADIPIYWRQYQPSE